jgi:hypothetical protein
MKTLFALGFSLMCATSVLAQEFEVVVRTENNRARIEKVQLSDLKSKDSFDGKYFKIVDGKSDEALSFNAAPEKIFRAATAYYHLTKARNYFINQLNSSNVARMGQVVVRIEHRNQFSELGHFAHDNNDPQFNNALTVPAGKGLTSRGVKPWGLEIWFRPKKKTHLNDLKVNSLGSQEMKVLMAGFRNQVHMQSLQRFLAQSVTVLTSDHGPGMSPLSLENLVRTVGSSLIIEAGYQFIDPISKASARKWYWLDTALVPEIIYHEFAHAALSDHLVLSHSTAIIEGMADFFAGQIANSPKLATRIKKYNTYNGKNAKRKQDYKLQFEMNDYANTDFVFGLLWELKNILGQEKGEAFMFELRKSLTTNSTIRGQLIEGILQTCDVMCEQPFNDKLRILKALNLRGI